MNWYQDCEQVFVELFGIDRLPVIAKIFAGTSINTSLKSNITLFRKALHELDNDLPFGNYLPNIKTQLEYIRAGKELSGRKINSFARAMSGDTEAVVVDIWLLRAFELHKKFSSKVTLPNPTKDLFGYTHTHTQGRLRNSGATKKQYDVIEHWVRTVAKCMGVEPRQLSAMIWAGVRIAHSGDRETHYRDRLKQSLYSMFNDKILITKTN